MKPKQTKTERIAVLERKLKESEASQVHNYHFASHTLEKASTGHLVGSGVVITLTVLGGREIFSPVMIRGGLSSETIKWLNSDILRSYEEAIELKPKGVVK